jgi:hypothetical protein
LRSMHTAGRSAGLVAIMNQTITIDGESYQADRTVVGAVDEMQSEIETLRNMLVRLAVFVSGEPCWCRCEGYTERQEGSVHSKVCRDILKLRLWPRQRAESKRAEIKTRTVHGSFWGYELVTASSPRRRLKSSQYLDRLRTWATQHGWQVS